MEKFYVLDHSDSKSRLADTVAYDYNYTYTNRVLCPSCGLTLSMIATWDLPHKQRISGAKIADRVEGSDNLYSEKFKHFYESNGLKGIDKFEILDNIRIRGKDYTYFDDSNLETRIDTVNHVISKFYTINLGDYKATVDFDKSISDCVYDYKKEEEHLQCKCRLGSNVLNNYEKIVLDFNNYNGEDIFKAERLFAPIVSERFYKLCLENNLTNISDRLIRLEDFKYNGSFKYRTPLTTGIKYPTR